jgi:choline kinase
MRAILLAAGRGRRLEADCPKCLVDIEGKTLLSRHLMNLTAAGIDALTIVVGYEQQKVREYVGRKCAPHPIPIDFVENPDFVRGSIVSLGKAMHKLVEEGGIFMDADVLYPTALMKRLVRSKHDNCVLIDTRSEETGEEMMVGVKGGRVRAIARKVSPLADTLGPFEVVGEAVGFAKVSKAGAEVLEKIIDTEVAAGRLDQEYEAAMNIAFGEIPWGYELVSDFEWTEIDFQEDVEKARRIARGE